MARQTQDIPLILVMSAKFAPDSDFPMQLQDTLLMDG